MYYPQYDTNLMMGCGNSAPAPAVPGNSSLSEFKKRTMTGLQHSTMTGLQHSTMTGLQQHAGTLATPGDNKQITHQILGTDNSDNVSNIEITGT